MTSRVSVSVEYTCSSADLLAALTSDRYWSDRSTEIGVGGRVVEYSTVSGATTSVVEQGIDTAALPKALQRFAGAHLTALCTETWASPGADGIARGEYTLAVTKMPITVHGDLELVATGEATCSLRFDGTVDAAIPVMGQLVEKVMVAEIDRGFEAEREYTLSWLATRSAPTSE